MNSKERIYNLLNRKKADRIGVAETLWGDTYKTWREQGHLPENVNFNDYFGMDIQDGAFWNIHQASTGMETEVIEETEDTILMRDSNGAVLRHPKGRTGTPEHVDYLVKNRADWEEHIKPRLTVDRARIGFDIYRRAKQEADAAGRFFAPTSLLPFEVMHNVTGHINLLMSMATDPDWIRLMVDTHIELLINLLEITFEEEGLPDGFWFYEDMGLKGRPFMSPQMYMDLLQPGHKRVIDFCHSKGLPVIVHSCGMVEALIPGLLDAGMDCLQAIEVKAGMDLLKLYKDYGDRLSFMGGIDVRVLYSNDKALIDEELEKKIPIVKGNNGFILHSDHSIPNTVDYETYRYFVDRGLELGKL